MTILDRRRTHPLGSGKTPGFCNELAAESIVLSPNSDDELARARACVSRYSEDAGDAAYLLAMVGLR